MLKINEILTLDLQEDIKNVIDLEDRSENEIQQEIESYIVTEGISRLLYNFTTLYTSNIKETGVWISGFYGSGKSYFGKMLGYILANLMINGTSARDRFIPRLKGVADENLIENAIRKLESVNNRVIFLDIAKQNTDRGLAFTLFSNLLKNLGFRDDVYGFMEFDLFIDGRLDEFKTIVIKTEGKEWDQLKKSNREVARIMRKAFMAMDYSESDYSETLAVYHSSVQDFSAAKFKIEIEKYLTVRTDEILVFIFDEASEAIGQKKFSLLDLEGLSEALSSISNKVWTIAIAQEKLDDVISNANINRSQLTKVTDRFKTKIHLESTEVDVIIRSRLLHKKESGYQNLLTYHKTNEGLVSDATNLKSSFPTKTKTADEFATYYPFHKYQFDILQNFLFSSNALVANQIAARGMIITTFDVLRKQMREHELFHFTPGYAICSEAQTAPPIDLVNKFDKANKTMKEQRSTINGDNLLKTIHFLADSELASPTVENITKSYISDITTYYQVKPMIEEALAHLVEAKILLSSNNNFKITSDLEGKLLEEMKDFDVELFSKKRTLIHRIKEYKLFSAAAFFNDGTDSFKFSILSDQDDELTAPGSKQLKLTVFSLYNISENRQDFVERIKLETQYQKDLITLVPDNKEFTQIDKLIGEVSRYTYMEEKYANESDQVKRQIIREFSLIREEKEKDLRVKIENAYRYASLVYLFDEYLLNEDNFKGAISEVQRKLIKNIYTKRLSAQLSESLIPKIFSNSKDKLSQLFSSDDFKFFDSHGNFTGDHLKVVEELQEKIKSKYVDGKTLEADLSGPPWGYSFGTVVVTLSALFRAGRLSVKYGGNDPVFSYTDTSVHEAFTNATKFKSASFKSIAATLTAIQKNQVVQLLMDLDAEEHIKRKVDWNMNDFDLADSIRVLAEHFMGLIDFERQRDDEFEDLFPMVVDQKSTLQSYAGKVTENNYIEKVEYLLTNKDPFSSAIQIIIKAQKFIKKNLSKVKDFKRFIADVVAELKKADRQDTAIHDASEEFKRLYTQDMVKNFGSLQQQIQIVKDSYFKLIKNAASGMNHEYQLLGGKVDAAMKALKGYPAELNVHNQKKLDDLKRYCSDRTIKEPMLEYTISCKNCGYSLSDILNYTALAPSKESELLIIQSGFIADAPPNPKPETGDTPDGSPVPKKPRKIHFQVPKNIMTVKEYKKLLTGQLTSLASVNPDEEIELNIETL